MGTGRGEGGREGWGGGGGGGGIGKEEGRHETPYFWVAMHFFVVFQKRTVGVLTP